MNKHIDNFKIFKINENGGEYYWSIKYGEYLTLLKNNPVEFTIGEVDKLNSLLGVGAKQEDNHVKLYSRRPLWDSKVRLNRAYRKSGSIFHVDDDWYILQFIVDWKGEYVDCYYQCDQFDGLIKCLKNITL